MKTKKIILLLLFMIICGCSNVKDSNVEDITALLNEKISKSNVYHTGYKYYLPSSLSETEYIMFNSVIEDENYKYYLYIDAVSYLSQQKQDYKINKDAYVSQSLNYDDKKGYLEINLKENNQYLIEIVFNYAKIEVMVDYEDINLALSYAVSILRSVEYNDNIIANLLGEDTLNYQEENYNIFNTTSEDSNYLKYAEDEADMTENENTVIDTDLLN